jgi:uncharacterized protein (TIGR00251 family)
MSLRLTSSDDGVRLKLKVVPGASRDRIAGVLGDALKVAVAQPPEGGAANRAVVQLLAACLKVPARSIEIVAGHSSPRKDVRIAGISADELLRRLAPLIKS